MVHKAKNICHQALFTKSLLIPFLKYELRDRKLHKGKGSKEGYPQREVPKYMGCKCYEQLLNPIKYTCWTQMCSVYPILHSVYARSDGLFFISTNYKNIPCPINSYSSIGNELSNKTEYFLSTKFLVYCSPQQPSLIKPK